MAKKIVFITFALAIGVFIYLVSISINIQKKHIELLQAAFHTSEYESYLAYNTPYFSHEPIYQDQNSDFHLTVYGIIGEEGNKTFFTYIIFINNLNEDKFSLATEYLDNNDYTNLIVKTDEIVYDHRKELIETNIDNVSLTYGYTQYRGYYFLYQPMSDDIYNFNLYNYEGEIYTSFDINYELSFDDTKSIDELNNYFTNSFYWQEGYTSNQKIELIIKQVNINMIYYGIIVIIFGLLVFRKSKRK